MYIAHTIADLRNHLARFTRPAFVPTMGNLHDGHIALVKQVKTLGDVTVASIFVNRLQFLPHEDFDTYPRTWDADCAPLEAAGCNVLFAPDEKVLYPEPQTYKVHPPAALADILEGHFRPGFFIGVSTVVMKLFKSKHLPTRRVTFRGYQREDGLWDIEDEIADTKTHVLKTPDRGTLRPGIPVHDMAIRVTVDDSITIREIVTSMTSTPFPECLQAQDPMRQMVGCTMRPGWRRAIEENLG